MTTSPLQELHRFGPIAASFALTQIVALLAYLAATTIFLKECGARYLPWTFLAGYILALILSALFRKLRDVSPAKLLAAYFTFHASFLFLSAWIGTRPGFALHLFVLSGIVPYPVLNWMLFWNSLEGALVLKEVKTWTPLVMAGGFFCQVITGLSTGVLIGAIGIERIFSLSGLLLFAALAVLWPTIARAAQVQPPPASEAETAAAPAPKDPLLASVARLIFEFAIFKYLVDYQLSQAVAARFTTSAEVAGFLGKFDSLTKATIFAVQTVVVGRLLARVPPGHVMAAMPVLLGLTSIAVVAGAGFPAILAANFVFTVFDKGLNRSCVNLLLAPFSPEVARQARIRLDGQVYGTGVVAISVAMIALPKLLEPQISFAVLVAFSAAYLFWCLDIDARYVRVLRNNLHSGSAEARASALSRLRAFSGRERVEALREMLASQDAEKRRQAARELARGGDAGLAPVLEEALGHEKDPRAQAELIGHLGRSGGSIAALAPHLDSPDPRVRASALEAIAELPSLGGGAEPARLLVDESPRARAAAAVAAVRHSFDRASVEKPLASLLAMLREPDAAWRSAACWALGRIGHHALVPALVDGLSDPELAVRRQAALGLERIWAPTALPALARAAAEPTNEPIAPLLSRSISRMQDQTRSEVIRALGHLSRDERLSLGVKLSGLGQEASELLSRVLAIDDARYRLRVGQALRDVRSERARAALASAVYRDDAGRTDIRLAPLLAALAEPDCPLEIWHLAERLRSRRNAVAAIDACRREAAALERETAGEKLSLALRRRLVRGSRMLGLAFGDRSVPRALITLARSSDRRAKGLSQELLEKVVTDAGLRTTALALAAKAGGHS